MNCKLPLEHTTHLKNRSKIVRSATKKWSEDNIICPLCHSKINSVLSGTEVIDFMCFNCLETFQLISSSKPFKNFIPGDEYHQTLKLVTSKRNPSLILLEYDANDMIVKKLDILHRSLINPNIISPRNSSSVKLRKAGWQGCSFRLYKKIQYFLIPIIDGPYVASFGEINSKWHKLASKIRASS